MNDATKPSRCTRCGAELPADAAEGLCPACLMAAAMDSTVLDPIDDVTALSLAPAGGGTGPRLAAGQIFGSYRIGRLLGRGGMGEVYAAEHLEHGRLVALKVLSRRLAGPEDRARFLREGRLAASVNHPNAVYIFGSEEIAGTPVIAMELVAGGTLKDRVERDGPMNPAAAVDAILDVVAGLDAAHAAGILHRDIKPSNCFVEPDGRVKVGDFGLSISTQAREVGPRAETRVGFLQGTPQYAAPEQLSGLPLDVRADIYAVAATLHYLLTGGPPFDDPDLMTLVRRVKTEMPVSSLMSRDGIPRGLAAIVLRCLAKDRATRPASYAELEKALRPFGSTAPTPATLGLRLVAGVIDLFVLALLTAPFMFLLWVEFDQPSSQLYFGVTYVVPGSKGVSAFRSVAVCLITLLYYVLLEGFGDASLGKRCCGLNVSRTGRPPGWWWGLVRSIVFLTPLWWTVFGPHPRPGPEIESLVVLVGRRMLPALTLSLIMFTSMRRSNGYAAWHDIVSGTRVVVRDRRDQRVGFEQRHEPREFVAGEPRHLGPFEVTGTLGVTATGTLLSGFDPVLRRKVWLHTLPPGSVPLAPALRDLARPGRLRWLNGRRRADEAWDAYEAPGGAPLPVMIERRQPWRTVRLWLLDLAREFDASARDGTVPTLAPDRVWITGASHAVLLDIGKPVPSTKSAGVFLAEIGAAVETGPLPLSARTTLDALARDDIPNGALVERMSDLAAGPDRVTSWRRGLALALANVPVIIIVIALATLLPVLARVARPDFILPANCLMEVNKRESDTDAAALRLRRALEMYCSATYGRSYADDGWWQDWPQRDLADGLRPLATRVVAEHPAVSAVDALAASIATREILKENEAGSWQLAVIVWLMSWVLLVCFVLSLLSALLVRGGVLMRLLGIAVVNRHGLLVSRAKSVWRVLIAWSPTIALWLYAAPSVLQGREPEDTFMPIWLFALPILATVAGAMWTIAHPARGLHDRIAGTSVVPR